MGPLRPSEVLTRLLLPLVLVLGGAGVLVTASPAQACSCKETTVEERAPETDVIFQGEAVDVRSDGDRRNVLVFEVRRVWKGELGSRVEVTSEASSSMCGLTVPPGQTRVIYADQHRARLSTSLCSAPFASGGDAALTNLLGEPRVPGDTEVEPPSPDWSSLVALRTFLSWLGLG